MGRPPNKTFEKRLEQQLGHRNEANYRSSLKRRGVVPLADVEIALERGDAATVAKYLASTAEPDQGIVMRLSQLLDPTRKGDPDWKLEFVRRKAGNSVSADEAAMKQVWIGNEALELYQKLIGEGRNPRGLWKNIYPMIAAKHGVGERTVQSAIERVRTVRRYTRKYRKLWNPALREKAIALAKAKRAKPIG